MPAVQRSPEPLGGYDENLQPVTDEGDTAGTTSELDLLAPTSRRTRSRLGAVGTFSRSLSRGTPVSPWSRPLGFQGAAGRVSRTPPARPSTRSSGLPLNSSIAFSPVIWLRLLWCLRWTWDSYSVIWLRLLRYLWWSWCSPPPWAGCSGR